MGRIQPGPELGVRTRLGFHPLHAPGAFETADASDGQGTCQPIESRERRAIIEVRWNPYDYRQAQVAAGDNL
jgi:hypothetical protein